MQTFSRRVAEEVLKVLGSDDVKVLDQCNCLNYTYVLINTRLGEFLGIAYTPTEDLRAGEIGVEPRVEELPELVTNLDSLVRALGVALINAISHYLVVREGLRLSQGDLKSEILKYVRPNCTACFVGSITPVAEALRGGCTVYQLERRSDLRHDSYPDIDAPLIIPNCDLLVITGSAIVNNTIDQLLALRKGNAITVLSGPTAAAYPPVLHDLGIDVVGSSLVRDPRVIVQLLKLGAGYRLLDKRGLLFKYVSTKTTQWVRYSS
ncbi:Rossmann-like domain-containing protein [Vulcanisaeta sp. JCM 14467]